MRTFERLCPFLVLVLLVGIAGARSTGPVDANHQLRSGSFHTSNPPRLDFGTVVRDTADEDALDPGPGVMPVDLQQQVPQRTSLWNLFFTRSWFDLLLCLR